MPNFTRMFAQWFQPGATEVVSPAGIAAVLDGETAVALTEACMAEAASLGAASAAALAWKTQQREQHVNVFGAALSAQEFSDPRGILAAALGLAMAGIRATAFLSAGELASARDLLAMAADRHLPLVIQVHNHALMPGGHQEACHLSLAAGCFVLCAANPQEAVDFTLVARRVAELALLPGVVVIDGEPAPQALYLPQAALLRDFIGSPQEEIPVPTPAQRLLFGETRRRLPRWHDPDRPVLQGALRDPQSQALGVAAQRPYFVSHLQAFLQDAFARFQAHTGRRHASVSSQGVEAAELVLVVQGAAVATAEAVADELRKTHGLHIGVLGLRCLRPFPAAPLIEALRKKRTVAVLEQVDAPLAGDPPILSELRANLGLALENNRFGRDTHPGIPPLRDKELPRLHAVAYGLGGQPLRAAELTALCLELRNGGRSRIYLGVEFTRAASTHPKRQVLLDTLRRDYPEIAQLGLRVPVAAHPTPSPPLEEEPPMVVRRLGQNEATYDSLPRFWNQVGVLYQAGDTRELTADPYLAINVLPPLSSTFRTWSDARAMLPSLDPARCSGCGQCWTACPDSAIGVVAIATKPLIDASIRLAGAEPLRKVATKLVARLDKLGNSTGPVPVTLDTLLATAFAGFKDDLSEESRHAAQAALQTVTTELGPLPLVRTGIFFQEPASIGKTAGQWLSLVINPDACKGCGLCVTECEPEALTALPPTPQQLAQAHKLWKTWEQLPDTPGATIERAGQDVRVRPLTALLLSRHFSQALAGGDGAEAGSAEKLALRWVLAIAESRQQPLVNNLLEKIVDLREAIAKAIRTSLTHALPHDNLEALAEVLEKLGNEPAELGDLTSRVHAAITHERVDAARLRRLVALSQALEDLHWRLATGPQGLGRARLSLVLAPGSVAAWAAAWPYNPFSVPVAMDTSGATPQLASGLLEGWLREIGAAFLLVREARLELDKPKEAARGYDDPGSLHWDDFTEEERLACPPLLLVGDDGTLADQGLGAVFGLLNGNRPVKILILANPDLGLASAASNRVNLGLLALAWRRAFVAQTSLAEPGHFLDSIQAALRHPGPALIHIHAPSPQRHGFATDRTLAQARLAVQSRVFPLFRYDPAGEGVFGSRLDLQGNPEVERTWGRDAAGAALTPLDWAAREQRFAMHFRPIEQSDPAPLPAADYLRPNAPKPRGKTPFVEIEGVRLRPDQALLAVSRERLQSWRTLQELAGLVTPFRASIEQAVADKITAVYEAELASLKQEHATRIRDLQKQIEAELAGRIRSNLLELAGYRPAGNKTHQGAP